MTLINRTIIGIAAIVLSGVSIAQARELRLATIAPESHNWTGVVRKLSKELAAHPELDLQIAVFPSAQLGQEPETMQQVEFGLLDMGVFTVASLSTRAPSLNGWFTPYLFKDVASAGAARKLPAAGKMLDDLSKTGIVGLGYTMAGMRHILSRSQPITSAAELKNKKVRITPFNASKIWWDALGAVPTPIPPSSLYQALQTGVIDLVDVDLDLMNSLSLYEVAGGLTMTGHMAFPGCIVISKKVMEQLSAEQQAGLRAAVAKVADAGIKAQVQAEKMNLETVRKSIKVIELDKEEAGFGAAGDAFDKTYGADPIIIEFRKEVGPGR